MRPAPLVIYHAACYDGFTAAWVFEKFYQQRKTQVDPEPEYYGAHYGEEPPDCSGRDVYVLDFSYPREQMIKKVILPSNRTIVYDHHKTAKEELQDLTGEIRSTYGVNRQNDKIVFDMSRSGAGITYDELSLEAGKRAGFHEPKSFGRKFWIVDYVEDRDLWKKVLPRTEAVIAYMGTVPMTFAEWEAMNASQMADIADKGEHVLRYIEQYGKKALDQARIETIAGHKVYTVNLPYMNCSEYLHSLLTAPNDMKVQPAFAASYFRTLKGEWQFSLRSIGEFDVSKVAQLFGGGGHKNAAGFKVNVLPWEKLSPTPVEDAENELAPMYGETAIPVIATPDGDDAAVKLGENSE